MKFVPMPELKPLPIATLLRRLVYEFQREHKIFDLPEASFWKGSDGINLGVYSHGKPAGTPFGPAAGPHTQMAQNIVLGWLGGARIVELKTIQVNDQLTIPRPCIDAANVCYNVEFSQELRLEESLEEYVKAWMLIRIIEHAQLLGVAERSAPTAPGMPPHFYDCIFDLSCGYNLAGIASDRVQWFIRSLMDAREEIERLRAEIPAEFAEFRELDFDPHIVSTATLSTFHGCPPDEIEGIVEHLLRVNRLHVVIKMNPTMLGRERVEELLHGIMGYTDIELNPQAFESGLQFDEAVRLVRRLRRVGQELGLHVGVKFSNTIEVLNNRNFFPSSEKVMYLSGPPLYPLALELAWKFRTAYLESAEEQWDKELQVSFSAGIDKYNFADAVAAGMVPVTVCTDLLKVGGYGRARYYLDALAQKMQELHCETIEDFIAAAAQAEPVSHEDPALRNHYAAWQRALTDVRYSRDKNSLSPKKVGSKLWLFDCVTCDKCIPVCPNDANFWYPVSTAPISYHIYEIRDRKLIEGEEKVFSLKKARQIANFGQFCNECGNCDTFCPEYGGPYIEKPTFFASAEQWQQLAHYDGFYIEHTEGRDCIQGRMRDASFSLEIMRDSTGTKHIFHSPEGDFEIDSAQLRPSIIELRVREGQCDIGTYLMLRTLLAGVLYGSKLNYVNSAFDDVVSDNQRFLPSVQGTYGC